MQILSENAKAILLLTSPLNIGSAEPSVQPLTPAQYHQAAKFLFSQGKEPADLVSTDSGGLVESCCQQPGMPDLRLLLGRGVLLSQAVERWSSRAIWIVSRADCDYPKRLKKLGEHAPPILYGCGDRSLLERAGLGCIASRKGGKAHHDFLLSVGKLAADTDCMVYSGGAGEMDYTSVGRVLESGGKACVVLGFNLGKESVYRAHRGWLKDGSLLLVSPFDPSFPGHQKKGEQLVSSVKVIHALSQISLIVDLERGSAIWEGAVDALGCKHQNPLYVKVPEKPSKGIRALLDEGALEWPEPPDSATLQQLLDKQCPAVPDDAKMTAASDRQGALDLG